jgi:serine/threonine-protein kinase
VFEPIAGCAQPRTAQIIHRDIKPDNIMVRERGRPDRRRRLLDFGIAKLVASAPPSSTFAIDLVIGTPLFMSPEQARDASRVDASSDIYSFAATVYAAFAGRPPLSPTPSSTSCSSYSSNRRRHSRSSRRMFLHDSQMRSRGVSTRYRVAVRER